MSTYLICSSPTRFLGSTNNNETRDVQHRTWDTPQQAMTRKQAFWEVLQASKDKYVDKERNHFHLFFLGAGMAKLLGRFYRGKCHYRVHRDDFLGREKIMIPTIVVKTSRAAFGASTFFAVVCSLVSSANQCRIFFFVSIIVIHKTELETW